MTAPDPMPLVERLRDTSGRHINGLYDKEAADEIERLRELADSEGTRAVDYLRRARRAEAEIERLTAALEAEKAEVFRLRDALAQAKGVPSASVLLAEQVLHMDMVTERGLRAREFARQVLDESHDVHEGECAAVLRDLASMLGAGGYNAPAVDAKVFREKILWGIDELKKVAATPPSPAQAAGWRDIESAPRGVEDVQVWCDTCGGSGQVHEEYQRGMPSAGGVYPCPDCGGEGFRVRSYLPLPAAPGHPPSERQGLTDEQIDSLRGLDTDKRVRFYEHDFYILSNFSAFTLHWFGCVFQTSEAAYHYEKFPTRHDIGAEILHAPSAHEAFKIAERNRAHRRPDWDEVKVSIMRDILRAKAAQHEYVRRKLLATGDRELVEDSWRDDFWGWGPNRDGQNMLGKLWMEIRAELRADLCEDDGMPLDGSNPNPPESAG